MSNTADRRARHYAVDATRIRLRMDSRVNIIERALIAYRLGESSTALLDEHVIRELMDMPSGIVGTITASKLLEQLDAHEARKHPVDIDRDGDVMIAHVPLDDDDTFDLILRDDNRIALDRDMDPFLNADEAEHMAYALLRLASIAREHEETKNQ